MTLASKEEKVGGAAESVASGTPCVTLPALCPSGAPAAVAFTKAEDLLTIPVDAPTAVASAERHPPRDFLHPRRAPQPALRSSAGSTKVTTSLSSESVPCTEALGSGGASLIARMAEEERRIGIAQDTSSISSAVAKARLICTFADTIEECEEDDDDAKVDLTANRRARAVARCIDAFESVAPESATKNVSRAPELAPLMEVAGEAAAEDEDEGAEAEEKQETEQGAEEALLPPPRVRCDSEVTTASASTTATSTTATTTTIESPAWSHTPRPSPLSHIL